MIPLPDGIDFETWAGYFLEEFALQGIPTSLPWREFVDMVQVYSNDIPELPRHEAFADWREWARNSMNLLA